MTTGDQVVWLLQFAFVDAKFRGLFSILFGAGMYVFYERSEARGEGAGRLLRRLAILLVFGLIHYFLIWRGDILTLYATWGLIAVAFLGWSERKQLIVGLLLSLIGTLLLPALVGSMWLDPSPSPEVTDAGALGSAASELNLYQHGSYARIVAETFANESGDLVQELVIVGITETLGLILLGMALCRYGLFTGQFDSAKLRRWGWAGVITGVTTTLALGLWPLSQGFPHLLTMFVFNGLGALPHLVTVLGLVALLCAWAPVAGNSRVGRRLAATGRMAFSNYLGISLLMMFVFEGWAIGLFGRFHRVELLAFVAGGWLLMLAWSPWWLARFRYGPLEWVWRCLTYGKLFRFRR